MLRTGVGQFGVIESHYLCSLIFLLTGIFGEGIWIGTWALLGLNMCVSKILVALGFILAPHALYTTFPVMKRAAMENNEFRVFVKYNISACFSLLGYHILAYFSKTASSNLALTVLLFGGSICT